MHALLAALALGAVQAAEAQQAVNPIHPVFAPLDAAGKKTRTASEVSLEKTCGACHDAAWIGEHTGHPSAKVKATCAQCHMDGGKLDLRPEILDAEGRLRREAVRIGSPKAANCGGCHGLIASVQAPVAVPSGFPTLGGNPDRNWSLTLGEGAIVSPQHMADSFLDLEGKEALAAPWDVHAAKLVDCTACHHAANDPAHTDAKHVALRYLTADPRRQSQADFLVRPDHRLAEKECRSCHDPLKAHTFLPYRERHMAVLACPTCHVSGPMGPAAEMVDGTVVTPDGAPVVRYRNVDLRPGESLNTARIRPLRPLLVERIERDGVKRLAPVNPVSRFRWVSGMDRVPVAPEIVTKAFLDGGAYAAPVLAVLDSNHDGRLDARELRLDTPAKVALIADRMKALGVIEPTIEGTLEPYPLVHGVSTRERALRECTTCHAAVSRVAESYVIASYLPGGTPPRPKENSPVELAGVLSPTPEGGLVLKRDQETVPGRLHVLGLSRQGVTNTIGFVFFVTLLLALVAHGTMRLVLRGRRAPYDPPPTAKAYVFGRYERIWHWTMALSGIVLILSGVAIHGAGARWPLDLPTAVSLHNVFAGVLMLNAFLSLFYHVATRAIRNFIPHPKGFLARALEHMAYQSRGIFFGGPHPANAPGHKLNPLQQVTYLALLNILFPLQIVTGLLIWAVGHWPEIAPALGGLRYLAPAHNLGAWLFLSFFVLHVYLVTTGRRPTEHLEAMITGYQAVEAEEPTP